MKKIVLLWIGFIMFSGCGTFHYIPDDIIGTYTQIRDDSVKSYIDLFFNKTNFALVDVATMQQAGNAKFPCCDTIATGKWGIDNQHGVLNLSTRLATNPFISYNVREDVNPHDDSVYFYITNPIEKEMGKRHKNIFYLIDLISSNTTLADSFNNKEFYSNKIVMPKREYGRIQEFGIRVYTTPEYFVYGRTVSIIPVNTFFIKVKNTNANSFYIDLPELNYQYISYQRFENRLLKIVNKNELIWDGVVYKKIK